ncbi:MAG: hypothetical protein ABRQ38_08030 [Candidatus Eremiobacterota bacterium]
MSIKEDFQIPENLNNIYKLMEISPVGILRSYALNLIHGKISRYEVESRYFEKKYNCSFDEFKNRIESMEEEENFEWDDDFMDWKFAFENLLYWQKKLQELEIE